MKFEWKKFLVEPTEGGFWCYDANRRSPGNLLNTPLSEVLKWIVGQIIYGHYVEQTDKMGEVVSLCIGQIAPYELPAKDAAEKAAKAGTALNLAGLIAEAREKGTSGKKTRTLIDSSWENLSKLSLRNIIRHVF